MDVPAAIAQVLKAEGVDYLFAYPLNPLIEAAAEVDIRPIIVRQERVGIHMADAVSRVTSGEKIGVFCMQKGPGAENAFGGVAQAHADSVPLVVLPMGFERDATHQAPNFDASVNYREITKSIERVEDPDSAVGAVRRAFNQARNGRPRPTLVELPRDVLQSEVGDDVDYTPTRIERPAPDPTAVPAVADAILAAECPVIYAGQGVHYAQAWEELEAFAERLEAPVTTSLQGKSAFDETHPLSLGSGGHTAPGPVPYFLEKADLVVGIGCSFADTPFGLSFPEDTPTVHATLDPADINRDVTAEHALVGDAKLTLAALNDAVDERLEGPRGRADAVAEEIADVREAWLSDWTPLLESDETPLSPYRVINDLMATVDVPKTIITHDAGSPRDELSPFWRPEEPLTYLGWGKSTQLGYGLGLAMGAKLARPDHLCVNVWGDAAIGMTGMDFETAARAEIPILSILFNNHSMAMEVPHFPVATEKYRATDIGGNYAQMAEAFGGYGERVEEPGAIVPAIERGIAQTEQGTPALLEFITTTEKVYSTVDTAVPYDPDA